MTTRTRWILVAALLAALAPTLSGCLGDDDDDDLSGEGSGTLEFYANGESFIREGLTTVDGWAVSFEHFYINLQGLTGIQAPVTSTDSTESALSLPAKHAGHPHNDIAQSAATVTDAGVYWLDLTTGEDRQLVSSLEAPVGNYNYGTFNVIAAADGEWAGYSIVLIGTATKGAETIAFTIRLTEQMTFSNCKQTLDDEYAGVVEKGGTGSMEFTFHIDHVLGDATAEDTADSVNTTAVGFDPLAALAVDGVLDTNQSAMGDAMSGTDFLAFIDDLRTIGHAGEGACNEYAYVPE